MNKKVIIIIIAAVVLVAGGVAAFFLLGGEKELPFVRTEHSPGEYFVVNINNSKSLLKTTVVVVLNTDTLVEMTEERNMEIRETIVMVLRSKTIEELKADDLSPVKKELVSALNKKLEIDNVIDILFVDYAVQ